GGTAARGAQDADPDAHGPRCDRGRGARARRGRRRLSHQAVQVRRAARGGASRTELLSYGPVELDRLKHKVKVKGKKLDLTPKEFQLLEHFLLRPEEVIRRTELLEKVWDLHFDPESNVVDVHVGNLRRKLKAASELDLIH